ncbi:MAG: NAD(P)/FAD-dependent oxidoreductase [Halanaerobiales bacterium]|nr:NAD(P)/FAD-dependent oxidoreductase [Halanaerobiales bacterium]
MSEVIVIGGGPAGMMAAGVAASRGKEVVLFEKNEKLGKKLYITGKGRCNFTNKSDVNTLLENVVNNKNFLYSAFYTMDSERLIQFFEDLGLKTKVERGNRVFPASDKASDVNKTLKKYLKENNVEIVYKKIKNIETENNRIKSVITEKDEIYYCKSLILATGGYTYRATGSTGEGYEMAKNLGHTINDLYPSLVPLDLYERYETEKLEGLSLKFVKIKVKNPNNEVIYQDFGDLVFTEKGVSGPIILSASSNLKDVKDKNYILSIDLKPALDYDKLDQRIQRDFKKYANKDFKNSLNDLLPSKLIPIFLNRTKIDLRKKVNQITSDEREKIISLLKEFNFTIKDYSSFDEGIITSGGVEVDEINPTNMESKIIDDLYFAGEIIDVDAYTGGFNLQIAFSTGYLAGLNV